MEQKKSILPWKNGDISFPQTGYNLQINRYSQVPFFEAQAARCLTAQCLLSRLHVNHIYDFRGKNNPLINLLTILMLLLVGFHC